MFDATNRSVMERDFEVGDIVRLKSGGPDMTVIELASAETCICQWFRKNNPDEVHRDSFLKETLVKTVKRPVQQGLRGYAL